MSKNTEHTSALLSRVCKQSCEKDSRAVVVDLPQGKAPLLVRDWIVYMQVVRDYSVICLSRSLLRSDKIEIGR